MKISMRGGVIAGLLLMLTCIVYRWECKPSGLVPVGLQERFIIPQGVSISEPLSLQNSSLFESIRILHASASCGCTQLSFDSSEIPPGGSLKGHMTLAASPIVGSKTVDVAIEWKFSNDARSTIYATSFQHITRSVANVFPPDIYLGKIKLGVTQELEMALPVITLTQLDGKADWSRVEIEAPDDLEIASISYSEAGAEVYAKVRLSGANLGFHQSNMKIKLIKGDLEKGVVSLPYRYWVGGEVEARPEEEYAILADGRESLPCVDINDASHSLECAAVSTSDPQNIRCILKRGKEGWAVEFFRLNLDKQLCRGVATVRGDVSGKQVTMEIPYMVGVRQPSAGL